MSNDMAVETEQLRQSTTQRNVETIVVSAVSKFGVKVGDEWYNVAEGSTIDLSQFQRGETYRVTTRTGPTGRKFITSVNPEPASLETVGLIKPLQPRFPQSTVNSERDASIVRQVAGKIAGDIVGKVLPVFCPTPESVMTVFGELYEPLFMRIHKVLKEKD